MLHKLDFTISGGVGSGSIDNVFDGSDSTSVVSANQNTTATFSPAIDIPFSTLSIRTDGNCSSTFDGQQ